MYDPVNSSGLSSALDVYVAYSYNLNASHCSVRLDVVARDAAATDYTYSQRTHRLLSVPVDFAPDLRADAGALD